MVEILDGKKLAEKVLESLKRKIAEKGLNLTLSIVLCGDDPESILYTGIKKEKSKSIGVNAVIHRFPSDVSEKELISKIKSLKSDGIIVQLPLPSHLNVYNVLDSIDPSKDVDCLTRFNLGNILANRESLVPATPKGVVKLLEEYKIPIKGKDITIINDSNLVGKPLAMTLLNRGATVTVCHKLTKNIKMHSLNADILITGVGIPNFIKKDMVKEGVVLVDIGITKQEGKILGDVDFENVKEKCSYITPVPGGVGPVTVAMLLENLVDSRK